MDMLNFNTNFTVQELIIEELEADYLYQRPLDVKRATRISEEFLEISENLPVVNIRDNKKHIVDGQHTIKAKQLRGDKTVYCKVLVDSLTTTQEAYLFFVMNKEQKEHTETAKIKVRYQFGDPYIRKLDEIANKHGFLIDWTKDAHDMDRKIFAVVKIYRIYDERGADVLEKTFMTIKECFDGSRLTLSRQFIGGISLFIFKYPDYITTLFEEYLNILRYITPENIYKRANDFRLRYSNSIRLASDEFIALAVLDYINKGRFGERKLENFILTIKD